MWKTIPLICAIVCAFYTNYAQATYNTGIKTRVYHHPQHHESHPETPITTSTHGDWTQNSGPKQKDNNYQAAVGHHYHNDGDSYQQEQRRGDNYRQRATPTTTVQDQNRNPVPQYPHPHSQQPLTPTSQIQPIFKHKDNSPIQNSENSNTAYYTGCPAGHTGQLPYAYDCRRFLNCWHGRGHIQTCSVGTVFNPETLECDRPDKVKCEAVLGVLGRTQSGEKLPADHEEIKRSQTKYKAGRYTDLTSDNVEVLCPPGAEGLQPHPSDCSRFINCANGNMFIQQCGPGTAYSISMKVCDFRNKVDCSGRGEGGKASIPRKEDTQATTTPSTPTGSVSQQEDLPHTADLLCLNSLTGLFVYPFDYTKFIHCQNGNTAVQNCVPGTAFSISKGYCESLDAIDKSDRVMYIVSQVSYEFSQTLITCPPGTEGVHLYPFNAELFVKCVKSQMNVVPCNKAHVFSVTRRTCLPSSQVSKHERVRLLSELQPMSNYHSTDTSSNMKNMIYCPGGSMDPYPHPFDSTKYLRCVLGRLMSESCASGQAFSLSRKVCALKEDISFDDYVPQVKMKYGQEWRVGDMEVIHGSIDGLTYLMCPPGVVGYFLHPFDCTKYIECSAGSAIVNNCLNGAVFSISHKECIPRDKVEAYDRVEYMTTTKNEFSNEPAAQNHNELGISCNPGMFGTYPHPNDCHKYIRCANGRLSVENCPAGQMFSSTRSFCHNEDQSDYSDRTPFNRGFGIIQSNYNSPPPNGTNSGAYQEPHLSLSPPTAPAVTSPSVVLKPPLPASTTAAHSTNDVNCYPGANGRYPHPFDCTKFLICTNGKTHIQDCALGTAWNKEMEVCDFNEKTVCFQSMTPSTSNSGTQIPCPGGVEGLYHHPYDWHKYLVCIRGQATVMNCAPGTVFSVSRRICDSESNVSNTDRCNDGVYNSVYDYTSAQVHDNREPKQGTQWSRTYTAPTKPTPTAVTDNRWTNMNVPRPQGSTTRHQTPDRYYPLPSNRTEEPVPVWSGTAAHVDEHYPAHTVIYEEGSFEPNRNYNRPMYNVPLAPLRPTTATTTATNNATIVYAQPVGSQEDSREIFSNTPTNPINSYNPQYYPPSNRENHTRHLDAWTPIRPSHNLMPSFQGQSNVYTNTGAQVPPPANTRPITQYDNEDLGQRPLSETYPKVTSINIDNLPGQLSYNLDDYDQLPSGSSKQNINRDFRLYADPEILSSTPKRTILDSFVDRQTTQIPEPLKITIPLHLSSATIQTFPHQPHYSPPYSEVAHSHNASWVGRKVPQYSSIKPIHRDPLNKITSSNSPQNYGIKTPPYSYKEGDQDNLESEVPETAMKAALKLLLKPYLDSDIKVDNSVAKKAQSHIMNLISPSDQDATTPNTTHKPLLNKNVIASRGNDTPHQEDVELILAGEQHNLVGLTRTQTGNHETSTSSNMYQAPLQPERSSAMSPTNSYDPNSNWHKHQTSHDPHHFKLQHSPEFHNKHPHLPNPYNDPASTTPNDFDLRVGGKCSFDCGNGKCVEQHEVCDGVNNCVNRKDEEDCGHLGYELRLTGGQSSNMGRVEVKILGKWGYVCDDKFGLRDADVVCQELGFKMGAMEVRGSSYYAPSDVDVYFAMDEVECKGNETSLRECDFKGWGVNNCGPDEVVGVVCKVPKLKCPDNYWLCSTSKECIPTAFLCDVTPDCEDGSDESSVVCNAPIKYRLEGGRSSHEGRLEVYYRGEWGTVCDDDFSLKEAQVFCNSIGLYGKPEIVKNIYGPGSGPIWLDQVSCLGHETKLDECNHWSWGENNCNHTEDVGLKCTAGPRPNPANINRTTSDDESLNQDKDLESTLQVEQTELDDLALYQGLWQRSSKAVQAPKKCGQFKSNLFDEYEHPEERVINGTVAKRGRHPWQATVRTRGRGGISSHWCGAVIISRKLILTAAHCLAGYPKGSYFVRMGDHYANIAEASEVDSNIENWYIHEKFRDQKHMNNDIALILLKTPVRFNDYVQPICLPEKGASLETNRMCTISGWGSIKSGTSTPSNILRSAQVPILADEVCSQKNVYANAMTEGMFCAGFLDESADACDGDSGGPLVCSDDDGETLYGIISWGQHCGYANHPGVYVRVEKYIDWIYDKVNLMMQQGKL